MDRSRSPLWPGQPYPLGATWDGAGVNFALFSEHATGVELCLYDRPDAATAREQVALRERTDLMWHGYMPGLGPGQLYGYRVHGPYALISQGVPMLCGGDEIGRTQQGNNNAYCQDNETSWFDWALDDRARRLLDFTRQLIRLRRSHAELHRRKFFQGRPLCSADMKDLTWHRPDGGEMAEAEWRQATLRAFAFRLCGDAMDDVNERGEPITDDTLLVLLNAETEAVEFVLPGAHPGVAWDLVVDTGGAGMPGPPPRLEVGDRTSVAGRSLQVLRAWKP